MPHPLRELLNREARAAAANVNATFVAYADSGFCTVTLRDTGADVLARLAISAQIAPGQEVIVSRPDGSGRSTNTNYTVIALAGDSAPGASPAITQSTPYHGVTINNIDPNPAILRAGDAVNIAIRGSGFLTVPTFEIAVKYGSDKLTDVAPPVVTDSEIDLVVKADSALTPGDYSLAIGTSREEELYFQVQAGEVRRLLATRAVGGFRIINEDTGAVLASSDGTDNFEPGTGSWIQRGDDLLLYGQGYSIAPPGPGFRYVAPVLVSQADASYELVAAGLNQWPRPGGVSQVLFPSNPRFVQFGSVVWYAGTQWNSDRSNIDYPAGFALYGINIADGSVAQPIAPPGTHDFNDWSECLVGDGVNLYALQSYQESSVTVFTLHKIDPSTATITLSADFTGFALRNGFAKDGFLYFLYDHFDSSSVRDFSGILKVDASTLSVSVNSELKFAEARAADPWCIPHTDDSLYVMWWKTSTSDGIVSRINLTTLLITHETPALTNYAFGGGPYFDHQGRLWVTSGSDGNAAKVLSPDDLSEVAAYTFEAPDVYDPMYSIIPI
jgi:hypothetical protein